MRWLEKVKQAIAANKRAEVERLIDNLRDRVRTGRVRFADDDQQFEQSGFRQLTGQRQPGQYVQPTTALPKQLSVREILERNKLRWGSGEVWPAEANQMEGDVLSAMNRRNAEAYGQGDQFKGALETVFGANEEEMGTAESPGTDGSKKNADARDFAALRRMNAANRKFWGV